MNMESFGPQWDLNLSGSWLPHLQTNGVEKINLPVTESSSLGKIQIYTGVKSMRNISYELAEIF